MGSPCGHKNVEGRKEVIIDVYRTIKRVRDTALRKEVRNIWFSTSRERGEFGHVLEGFCEEGVESLWLLVVDGDGEGAEVGRGVWARGKRIEDGEAVGGGGNGDGSVEGALSHRVEDVTYTYNGEEIWSGEAIP